VKMRWDEEYLYVGGFLEERQTWANLTVNNSIIFYDNDFEVFVDPDGSNRYYKELEFNALNINWNLLLVRAYLNGGPAVCNFTVPDQCVESAIADGVPFWDIAPYLPSATYVSGKINDPITGTRYWSIEIGIPLKQYVMYNRYSSYPPKVNSYWRINFSRVEYHIYVHQTENGPVYWKNTTQPVLDNWVWQPTYVSPPDIHLPETWGYVQFADGPLNETPLIRDPQWPVRDVLMKVYYALVAYRKKFNNYVTDIMRLQQDAGLPSYVVEGACASVPEIVLVNNATGFEVTASLHDMIGHVGNDRSLWFGQLIVVGSNE